MIEMRILTVNGGSSSIKFALYEAGESLRHIFRSNTTAGAVARSLDQLGKDVNFREVSAVGHRIVHGGPHRFDPQLVTPELLADLRAAMPLDPNHLPGEIALIEAFAEQLPGVPQIACFDTAFHKDLPRVATMLPIPRKYIEGGIRRYGFHGLSYTYLLEELERQAGKEAARGRVIFAHLGSGSSLSAVNGGICIDTTMGFTPAGGVMMGTRTGDIDPGVLVYLMRSEGLTADQLDALVNKQSGLLGVSGATSDMREILASRSSDPWAQEAFDSYCYSIRKALGAMAAALGGFDTLVFSGGIGENCPEVRMRICEGLDFLGIDAANIRVIPTDEESVIARAVFDILRGQHP